MVTVRLTDEGSDAYRSTRDGLRAERGETVDVEPDRAEYLVKHQGFEVVDGLASFETADGDEDAGPETYTCDEDGCDFETETPQGLAAHSRSHG